MLALPRERSDEIQRWGVECLGVEIEEAEGAGELSTSLHTGVEAGTLVGVEVSDIPALLLTFTAT